MLFKKKLGESKRSSKAANAAELITDHSGSKAIVFGLQWRSVATAGGRDTAAKIARAGRASHFIYRGQQIGYGTIRGKVKDLPPSLYPAALLAAKQHAGDSIFVIRIDESAHWVALIRNGSPTSTDRFLEGLDDAGALALAREIFEPLEQDGIKLGVFTNIERSGIDGARLTSVEDLLDVAIIEDDRLQVVPFGGVKIPKPVLGVLGLAVLLLVGQRLYDMWDMSQRAKLAAQNAVVEEDPAVAWDRAIANWRQSVEGHAPSGLALVRNSMADLPAKWDGWLLVRSNCTRDAAAPVAPEAVAAATQEGGWSCTAAYVRQSAGVFTREMAQKVPDRWQVSFSPLNEMQLSWRVTTLRTPMVVEALPGKSHHNIETVSKLQRLAPALSESPDFTFVPVVIPTPVSTQGVGFPPDARAEGISQAEISLRGPLRTIDAAINAGLDLSWTSLTLAYAPAGAQVSIQSSVITAEAVGVMYAKN